VEGADCIRFVVLLSHVEWRASAMCEHGAMKARKVATLHVSRTPLVLMFADGACLSSWSGLRGGAHERVRVSGGHDECIHWSGVVPDREGAEIEWPGGEGVLADLGEPDTAPVVEIHHAGSDFVVGARDFATGAAALARRPANRAIVVGDVRVETGALAITSAPEPPERFNAERLAAVHSKGVARFEWGAIFRVPPAIYRVAVELVESPAERRLRIVPVP
jgi:hypothetical protein